MMQQEIHPSLPRLRIHRRRGGSLSPPPRAHTSRWAPYLPSLATLLLLPVLYGVSWLALKQSQAKGSQGRALASAQGYLSRLSPTTPLQSLGGVEPLWSHDPLHDEVWSLHRSPPDGSARASGTGLHAGDPKSGAREELKVGSTASAGMVSKGKEGERVTGGPGLAGLVESSTRREVAGASRGGISAAKGVPSAGGDSTAGLPSGEGSEPTTLKHVFFNIGSSTRMWPRRKEIIRTWWLPGETQGFVWLEAPVPQQSLSQGGVTQAQQGGETQAQQGGLTQAQSTAQGDTAESSAGSSSSVGPGDPWGGGCLPVPMVSSDVSHLQYRGTGLRDFLRHARMVVDAFRLNTTRYARWFVVGDDDTFFSPRALAALLATLDPRLPWYLGASSETHFQNAINSHAMAFGGGGYAVSRPLARLLNASLDPCLDRHSEMWGSDMRFAACAAEAGVALTQAPGMHQCDIGGNAAGLLQSHPLHPFVSMHHLEFLHPVLALAGEADRIRGLRRLSGFIEPDPVGFLQQALCWPRSGENWTASIAWGLSIRVYPGIQRLWEMTKVERAFFSFTGHAHPMAFMFDTRNFEPDAAPHLPCGLPFTLHVAHVGANPDGSVVSVYRRLATRRPVNRSRCREPIARVSEVRVSRARPMRLRGAPQMVRQRCGGVRYVQRAGEEVAEIELEDVPLQLDQ